MMALGLIAVRASSCIISRMARFHSDDSPGDAMAANYGREAMLDRLTDLYDGDKQRASIVTWRIEQLTRAGFDELRASTIAATDVDWRKAIELVRSGCSHELATDIVLE